MENQASEITLVKYNPSTFEVEGFFTEFQRDIIGQHYIEITKEKELELINEASEKGTLYVTSVDLKQFVAKEVSLNIAAEIPLEERITAIEDMLIEIITISE